MKEKLYIGEATVATIMGLILGPHCLDWINPLAWGNADHITLEICRIVLCIQIVAVAVELPRKYMKKHWVSVAILLLPVMTCGWLVVGLFIWILIPNFNFLSALLVSACVTATDPVLAAAVVGKGKFAERVPGHLRNLLTAESGCNDGMAFPFIFLSLYLIIYDGHPGEIIKHWFTLTILWECFFGVILGVTLGYLLRKALFYAERWNLIDRESFLALFVFLALTCAGVGSMLGVDDLLVSFAAGTAFGWNGDFAKKTEESHVSTVIDLLLNLTFFVYFGSIVPWPMFNDASIGLNVWRLVILAVVIIFLRRIPAVLALKPFTPDIKTWREALFCGHFGPIGVGAIFAAILARKELEAHFTTEETPLAHLPDSSFPHYQLIAAIWPMVCFVVVTSIIVHGSSVAVLALGRRLNRMALTMSLTATTTHDQGGPSWMSRLQKLEHASTSFSLHRIDTNYTKEDGQPPEISRTNTIETLGVKVRPAGGARRKRAKKKLGKHPRPRADETLCLNPTVERQRPAAEFLQLGRANSMDASRKEVLEESSSSSSPPIKGSQERPVAENARTTELENEQARRFSTGSIQSGGSIRSEMSVASDIQTIKSLPDSKKAELVQNATTIYEEGLKVILEDADGEVIKVIKTIHDDENSIEADQLLEQEKLDISIHSMSSLRQHMSNYSVVSENNGDEESVTPEHVTGSRKTLIKKGSKGKGKRYYAHQVDDILMVENEDGDIVRRYRLNRHKQGKARSGLIVQKALSMVGIKNKDKEASSSTTAAEVKHQAPAEAQGVYAESILLGKTDSKMTKKVNALLNPKQAQETDVDTSMEATSSDNEKEETEVERRRRLAALGRIDASRDASDEE